MLFVVTHAAENQKIIFSGSYSLDNVATDADSAWLFMYYYASLVGSTTVTAEDLQWDGYYQHTHQCTNDSADGWSGVWTFFDNSETIQVNEVATVATARDSGFVGEIFAADMSLSNNYGTWGMAMNALAGVQALALAAASHEQTTTRIALNLTATTNDVFNGCLLNCRSGVNAGFTTRITDYEAYSGDSGVVIVSPALVLAATENQAFVITSAIHAVGDTNNSLYQGNVTRAYVWSDVLNPDGKYITNSDGAVPIALDNATGSFDKDDFEDDFFETMSDTNRIRNDSLFALAVATIDSLNKVLDSLYAIMDSLATQAWWSTSDCEGVGAYTCTLYVTDTLNDWRVPDVNVSINNQAEDAKPRVIQTNANGRIIVQYSDGDYRASCLNPMLRNNEGGSPFLDFTVDGAPVFDSLMGYLQSVGSPVAAEACSVYGWLYDVKSQAVDGATIIFELVSDQDTLYYDNVTYVPSKTVTHSNSDGYWSICVIPNELLDTLSFYSVDIIRDHPRMPILDHSDVYVPDSTTVKFNDLLISFNRKGK